jgi:hypothetical protein
MRPLETEHRGFRIRVIAHSVGRGWSALVEVWPPGSAETAEAQVVPFNGALASEKLAQSAGRDAAIRWVDRQQPDAAAVPDAR